jgi:hypothetical protein
LVILNHPYQSNEQHILPSNHSTQQMTFTYLAGNAGPGLLIAKHNTICVGHYYA